MTVESSRFRPGIKAARPAMDWWKRFDEYQVKRDFARIRACRVRLRSDLSSFWEDFQLASGPRIPHPQVPTGAPPTHAGSRFEDSSSLGCFRLLLAFGVGFLPTLGWAEDPTPVPDHAYIDVGDPLEVRGFKRVADRCVEIQVPQHAFLNFTGNDWVCDRGFKREGNRCSPE